MKVRFQIFKNRMVVSNGIQEVEVRSSAPFSTERLLVGNFDSAWACAETAEKKLSIKGWFKNKPTVVVEPKEMIEGGLCQVEERVLMELACAFNPRATVINV